MHVSLVNAVVQSKESMVKDAVPLSCGRAFISPGWWSGSVLVTCWGAGAQVKMGFRFSVTAFDWTSLPLKSKQEWRRIDNNIGVKKESLALPSVSYLKHCMQSPSTSVYSKVFLVCIPSWQRFIFRPKNADAVILGKSRGLTLWIHFMFLYYFFLHWTVSFAPNSNRFPQGIWQSVHERVFSSLFYRHLQHCNRPSTRLLFWKPCFSLQQASDLSLSSSCLFCTQPTRVPSYRWSNLFSFFFLLEILLCRSRTLYTTTPECVIYGGLCAHSISPGLAAL